MIRYTDSLERVTPDDLRGFFVGWQRPPSPETHLEVLKASWAVELAVEDDEGVIGFASALSDGILMACISLVEVLPHHQKQGIGSELLRRITSKLDRVYGIDVVCDESVVPFYESVGMKRVAGLVSRSSSS